MSIMQNLPPNRLRMILGIFLLGSLAPFAAQAQECYVATELVPVPEDIKALAKAWTIDHGGFRWFRTGQTRQDAYDALKTLRIQTVFVRPAKNAYATRPEDVERLRDAEAIAVDSYRFVEFKGDNVMSIRPSPSNPDSELGDREILKSVKTREQILDLLRRHLRKCPGSRAYATIIGSGQFEVRDSPSEWLSSYPGWAIYFNDKEGSWDVILWFEGDILENIAISFFPFMP